MGFRRKNMKTTRAKKGKVKKRPIPSYQSQKRKERERNPTGEKREGKKCRSNLLSQGKKVN